ncbi:MAG: FYDLN acid domain-containing protein [Alphaproteobacteria bacterium]|nr:FYDLN acid domain-containing protein [Alphaproteobacteria bacterium]
MDKKDWGIKRVCIGCGARFYDFNKTPIVCPSCGMIHDPEYLSKRKSKTVTDKVDEDIIIDDDVISESEDEDIVGLDDESDDDMVSLNDAKE